MLAKDYMVRAQGPSYKIINEIIGVLECVKLEFYRRIAAHYENEKQQQNGDVYYPLDLKMVQEMIQYNPTRVKKLIEDLS